MPVLPDVASITVCPGLSSPDFLRRFNDAESQTIFDGTERVECFVLDEQVDAFWRQLVDTDYRSPTDGLKNVGEFTHQSSPILRSANSKARI